MLALAAKPRHGTAASDGNLGFTQAQLYRFPMPVADQSRRSKAAALIATMRPDHWLLRDELIAWYITTPGDAQVLVDYLTAQVKQPVGFDYETHANWSPERQLPGLFGEMKDMNGLSPSHPAWKATPATFQVSWGQACYVVLGQYTWMFSTWLTALADLDIANAPFESSVSLNVGIPLHRFHRDPLQMHYQYNEMEHQQAPGLKAITWIYTGLELLDFDEVFDLAAGETFDSVLASDPVRAVEYAAKDPFVTTLLADVFEVILRNRPTLLGRNSAELYFEWERPYQCALGRMERAGVPLHRDTIKKHGVRLKNAIDEIEAKSYAAAGRVIDLGSNKDLLRYYYVERQKPVVVTNEGFQCIICQKQVNVRTNNRCKIHGAGALVNTPKVDAEVLEALAKQGDELAQLVQDRRSLVKDLSTTIETFWCYAAGGDLGYPSIMGAWVVSGRLSAGSWLTIPDGKNDTISLRDIVGEVEDSDEELAAGDYGQVELRILTHLSGDEVMAEVFLNDRDMHSWTGTLVECYRQRGMAGVNDPAFRESIYLLINGAHLKSEQGLPLTAEEKRLKGVRKDAKPINFGLVYGMGPANLAKQLNIPLAQAQELFSIIEQAYAGTTKYFNDSIAEAKKNFYLWTLLGRIRHLEELRSPDAYLRSYGERLVKNTPCQAGGGDVIRGAMIQLDMDTEAGGFYGTVGRMAYGHWVLAATAPPQEVPGTPDVTINGMRYIVDFDRLPRTWRAHGLPPALKDGFGSFGRRGWRLVLQCHDELIARGKKINTHLAKPRMEAIMRDPFGADLQLKVPLKVNVKSGRSWEECH